MSEANSNYRWAIFATPTGLAGPSPTENCSGIIRCSRKVGPPRALFPHALRGPTFSWLIVVRRCSNAPKICYPSRCCERESGRRWVSSGIGCHWRRKRVSAQAHLLRRVPGRGTEHPRAFALAPGGDSGAVPTTMAIRAGAEMATPNGRRYPKMCATETFRLGVDESLRNADSRYQSPHSSVYCTKGQYLAKAGRPGQAIEDSSPATIIPKLR